MKALLIDHDDSFTYNLRDWLNPAFSVEVRNHRDLEVVSPQIDFISFSVIVLSPGPKAPSDYPHVKKFIKSLDRRQKIFGVCLGMQILNECEGGGVFTYTPPLHGKKSKLISLNSSTAEFHGLSVARYHSLQCEVSAANFEILAQSENDNIPMWIKHKSKNLLAFQFHPESFLTERPDMFLNYLTNWCRS